MTARTAIFLLTLVLSARVAAATIAFEAEAVEAPKEKIAVATIVAHSPPGHVDEALTARFARHLRATGIAPASSAESPRFLCTLLVAPVNSGRIQVAISYFEVTKIGPCANPFWMILAHVPADIFRKHEAHIISALLSQEGRTIRGEIALPKR